MPVESARSLQFHTPPAWAAAQVGHGAELLLEQAHLEKKAAAAAVGFLFRVPAEVEGAKALSLLAREELVHFERSLKLLAGRGIAYVTQPPGPYAERLKRGLSATMPLRLVDELLIAAVIEARSCERMRLLAAAFAVADAPLAEFYADLVEAEARHEPAYVAIAQGLAAPEVVEARWAALASHEAAVLAGLPFAPRLHSGCQGLSGRG